MVLVNEILYMVNQYMRGISVDDESLAIDFIDKIGPGGHYLNEDHTMEHFKNIWYSDLFDRKIYDVWLEEVGVKFDQRLMAKTETLMNHRPEPLHKDAVNELEVMQKHWE